MKGHYHPLHHHHILPSLCMIHSFPLITSPSLLVIHSFRDILSTLTGSILISRDTYFWSLLQFPCPCILLFSTNGVWKKIWRSDDPLALTTFSCIFPDGQFLSRDMRWYVIGCPGMHRILLGEFTWVMFRKNHSSYKQHVMWLVTREKENKRWSDEHYSNYNRKGRQMLFNVIFVLKWETWCGGQQVYCCPFSYLIILVLSSHV